MGLEGCFSLDVLKNRALESSSFNSWCPSRVWEQNRERVDPFPVDNRGR